MDESNLDASDMGGSCSRKQGQQVNEDGAFRGISQRYSQRLNGTNLHAFRGCALQDIDLCEYLGVDDSWMDVISSQGSSLLYADLSGSYVTDCGLVHFKDCENIQSLEFQLLLEMIVFMEIIRSEVQGNPLQKTYLASLEDLLNLGHHFTLNALVTIGIDFLSKTMYLEDRTVHLYSGGKMFFSNIPDVSINSLSFNPLNELLMTAGSADKTLKVFDMRNLTSELYTLKYHKDEVFLIEWSRRNKNIIASSSSDRRLVMWDTSRLCFQENDCDIYGVEITDDAAAGNGNPSKKNTAFLLGNEASLTSSCNIPDNSTSRKRCKFMSNDKWSIVCNNTCNNENWRRMLVNKLEREWQRRMNGTYSVLEKFIDSRPP
ncbi:F-box/LRR-repeat protein 14-like protein isoform X2 [Tanacetum coccineum]